MSPLARPSSRARVASTSSRRARATISSAVPPPRRVYDENHSFSVISASSRARGDARTRARGGANARRSIATSSATRGDEDEPDARGGLGRGVGAAVGVPSARVDQVLDQALPVMGGMASQNVLNLADAAMVGRLDEVASPLNAALILVCAMGVPMAILAFANAEALVPLYTSDASVVANAVPYLRARLLAVPAVGMNFAFRGFWNAIQQPQVYMNTLIVMHTLNVTLSLILTFVGVPQLGIPPLGALGAGLGTSFSLWCGTAMYVYQGIKRASKYGFLQTRPTMTDLKVLATQAAPTSVTNLLYASGMMTLYSIVGRIGTTEVAAVNVLINLMLFLVLPCMGMGLAAGALSGRALGRGDVEDAKQWPWDVAKITAALMSVVGIILAAFPRVVLAIFLNDPHAVDIATTPLRMTGLTVCGDAMSLTMQNALLGVGDAKRVALVSILSQWAVFLPSAYLAVVVFNQNLTVVWALYVSYRFVQGLVYANIWRSGAWSKIRLH